VWLVDSSLEAAILFLRLAMTAVLYLFLLSIFLIARRELNRQARRSGESIGRLVLLDAGATSLPPGHALPLQSVTTLGRGVTSTLVLNDSFVSTTHAVLTRRGDQWWLRDAGSTNGTRLEGEPVGSTEIAVQYGDVIEIGRIRLKLAP
jgi:hypothetical protein